MSFEQNPSEQVNISGADLAILVDENKTLREQRDNLQASLLLLLDQVDYTRGACRMSEMVGACLDASVIDRVRATLESLKPISEVPL